MLVCLLSKKGAEYDLSIENQVIALPAMRSIGDGRRWLV